MMASATIDPNEILNNYRNLKRKFEDKTDLQTPVTDSVIPAPKVLAGTPSGAPCAGCDGSGLWKGKEGMPCFSCDGTGVENTLADKIAKFTNENPRAVEWMETGTGGFQKSLLQQFHKKGYLSRKQMSIIEKRLAK